MLNDKDREAYINFYDAVRDGSTLDQKTTLLIGLAAALTSGCEP